MAAFLHEVEVQKHALVDGSCTEASAHEQDGFLVRVETELLSCLFLGEGSLQYVLAYWISRHDDFVGREETFHSFVSHAYLFSLLCQELVGYTCV